MILKTEAQKFWQIGGGPSDRSYVDQFLKYGVALIGPGDPGKWDDSREDSEFETSTVRRFVTDVQIDDAMVLRRGQDEIVAIGLVASDYEYFEQFDDVNGWDLQHCRRVRWSKLPTPHKFSTPVFGGRPGRLSQVWNDEIFDFAKRYINSDPHDWQSGPLPTLPNPQPSLDAVPDDLADIVALARDLYSLYWDQEKFGDWPMESELVAHYVVPFLRALGWSVECIGVEWRKIDVIVFRQLPRIPANVQFVIEAKRLGSGVEGALDQARGYIATLGVQRDLVVTDGIRYRMYEPREDGFESVAYANLWNLKANARILFDRMRRK
ncbi:MAG: hypothetical protein HY597_05245 [Candidatus Omnitrophica bacterium]|nr:hypothetical protein [Candidatus Omnitrophota bacterium]